MKIVLEYGPICPICKTGITGVDNFGSPDLPGYMVIKIEEAVKAVVKHVGTEHEIGIQGHAVEYDEPG